MKHVFVYSLVYDEYVSRLVVVRLIDGVLYVVWYYTRENYMSTIRDGNNYSTLF